MSPSSDPAGRFDVARLRELAERAEITIDELLDFLSSPAGRRLRAMAATGLILSVPVVMRVPGLRGSALGRAIELLGGTALIVKLAEAIRDWDRGQEPPTRGPVVDVPPSA
jgi:hypothetical protein